jgi:hypothetical protein
MVQEMNTLLAVGSLSNFDVFLNDLFDRFCALRLFLQVLGVRITSHEVTVIRNYGWMVFSKHVADHGLAPHVLFFGFFVSFGVSKGIGVSLNSERQ